MKQYLFRTNINCGGCVAKVTPLLNADEEVKSWNVDTLNPAKILTVETERLSKDQVKGLIEKAGFKAEII